jgi:hypothetical protein
VSPELDPEARNDGSVATRLALELPPVSQAIPEYISHWRGGSAVADDILGLNCANAAADQRDGLKSFSGSDGLTCGSGPGVPVLAGLLAKRKS